MAIGPLPNESRSIVRLIAEGTLDPSLAALLWLTVEARVPIVVAAGPSRTGKTTLLQALLAFLPPTVEVRPLSGYAEDFEWLPEASALGWRRHGFGGIGLRGAGTVSARTTDQADPADPADPADAAHPADPAATFLLVHEFSDHLPIYTWGEQARVAVRALSLGYGLGGTIHAMSLEEVFAELGGSQVGLTDDELSRLGVVVILRTVPGAVTGNLVRRVVAAHYVRPVARDVAGHTQRLGPAVLSTWDPGADRHEDFSWGVVPELAERVGRRAGDLEVERDRRAAVLATLVRSRVFEPGAVRDEFIRHSIAPGTSQG
jgi:hypothetical protein